MYLVILINCLVFASFDIKGVIPVAAPEGYVSNQTKKELQIKRKLTSI